jgi:peptidoglycan/LPS O-acetylase OafA/YrhL
LIKGQYFELEGSEKRKKDTFECTKLGQVLLCFSWYSNIKKIFTTAPGKGDPLDCLNAVRVMSMGWVILGHLYGSRVTTPPLANPLDVPDTFKQASLAIVYGAYYSVDVFFWMGGLLMAYLFVKELEAKNGRVKWGLVYFHRFWRILPPYMFVFFGYWALMRYIGDGPIWWKIQDPTADCIDWWWT